MKLKRELVFYYVWIKGLEIMKGHNVQFSYPSPVDEYDLHEEVKTKKELDAIWDNTLEIFYQRILIYEQCLGRECTNCLLNLGGKMIDKEYLKEGESVIKRGVLLEISICEELCSKPPNSYPFPRFYVTHSVRNIFHVSIDKLLKTAYPPNYFPLYIKFGLTALKTKYHLQLPVEPDDKHEVLRMFSMSWIKICESSSSSYPFELMLMQTQQTVKALHCSVT